ncbi:MAG TPA: hypothetical protein VK525_19440 [Candidatus Saccharimonadales bacterium]|nr:hypothetical protein [Candidatus Saccharimonadales bacterium]
MPPDMQIAPRRPTPSENRAIQDRSAAAPVLSPEKKKATIQRSETSCFLAQSWHLPYAEALIEDVPSFLPISIVYAERAILNRYLELADNPEPLEERLELWRAVEALRKLKKKVART